jgi:hypothetical protein
MLILRLRFLLKYIVSDTPVAFENTDLLLRLVTYNKKSFVKPDQFKITKVSFSQNWVLTMIGLKWSLRWTTWAPSRGKSDKAVVPNKLECLSLVII